jgi:23S rRNA pseudouridine1911/1915/1917 synthase
LRSGAVSTALHGQRLDKVLVSLAPEFSRNHLQQLLLAGHVRVDGQAGGAASRKLKAGQTVQLRLVPTDESRAFTPQPMALEMLFEDEHVLVINKPAGLVVHPAPGNWSGTLLNGLLAHHAGAMHLPRAGIVHRLDKDTSGLMVVAKTLPAMTALVRDMAARHVQRRYLALAHGTPPEQQCLEMPIGRDPRVRVRMAVVPVAAGGKAARTDVQVLAQSPGNRSLSRPTQRRTGQPLDAPGKGLTNGPTTEPTTLPTSGATSGPTSGPIAALLCTLHTGRTHQIRVHLSASGYPLLADAVYGGAPGLGLERQALHAARLAFQHPITQAPMSFQCLPPADFSAAWAAVAGATMPLD